MSLEEITHLEETLCTQDPLSWSGNKDITTVRRNLQDTYLRVIIHSNSESALASLWTGTISNFITVFEEKLSLDPNRGCSPPGEYRQKLLQRFRHFLAEEEKLFAFLISRFCMPGTESVLSTLKILAKTHAPPHWSHLRFPDKRESKQCRTLLCQMLIYIGHIAYFKELYNEAQSRPKAGQVCHDLVLPTTKKKIDSPEELTEALSKIPRGRDFSRAESCYREAYCLDPDDGRAAYEMAVLASRQKKTFESISHFYRSLCAPKSGGIHREDLRHEFCEAVKRWKTRDPRVHNSKEPRHRIRAFKDNVVALHAFWYLEAERKAPREPEEVLNDFSELIEGERHLPKDIITQAVILAHGAFAINHSPIDTRIFCHIISLHQILLQACSRQLSKALEIKEEGEMMKTFDHQRTSLLPALRISAQWLRTKMKQPDLMNKLATPDNQGLWEDIVKFSNALWDAFSARLSKTFGSSVYEDEELQGFLLLGKFSPEGKDSTGERTLSRIAGLVKDLRAVARPKNDVSPIAFDKDRFVLWGPTPIYSTNADGPSSILSGETDDDPVKDAFKQGPCPPDDFPSASMPIPPRSRPRMSLVVPNGGDMRSIVSEQRTAGVPLEQESNITWNFVSGKDNVWSGRSGFPVQQPPHIPPNTLSPVAPIFEISPRFRAEGQHRRPHYSDDIWNINGHFSLPHTLTSSSIAPSFTVTPNFHQEGLYDSHQRYSAPKYSMNLPRYSMPAVQARVRI